MFNLVNTLEKYAILESIQKEDPLTKWLFEWLREFDKT